MTRRPTDVDRDNAAAWAAYSSRTSHQAERAVRVLLATVVGVLLALALVHWLTPCTAGPAAICLAPMALPTRWRRTLQRLHRRLLMALLHARLRQLQGTAQQMALDDVPPIQLGSVLAKAAATRLQLAHLQQQHRVDLHLQHHA